MLAASCRVCVACKQPIDAAQIVPHDFPTAPPQLPEVSAPLAPVRFPWRVFFAILGLWMIGATVVQWYLGPLKSQLVLGGVQILSSVWVFYDASGRRLPKPLRWGLGSLLLWPLVFPWYLARRKNPEAPCPFVEEPTGPLARALLLVLLAVLVFLILKGPPPKLP
jgi:hypothetical protein